MKLCRLAAYCVINTTDYVKLETSSSPRLRRRRFSRLRFLERGGFAKYKRDLDAAAQKREAAATAAATERAAKRARDRRAKLQRAPLPKPPKK